jgi:hypothetical protein
MASFLELVLGLRSPWNVNLTIKDKKRLLAITSRFLCFSETPMPPTEAMLAPSIGVSDRIDKELYVDALVIPELCV